MMIREKNKWLTALMALLLCGCSQALSTEKPWVDVSQIHEGIIRDEKKTIVLEEAEEPAKQPGPRTTDLSSSEKGENAYLTNAQSPSIPDFSKSSKEGILLNFDNADIYEFIQVITAALELNYIVDPHIKGVVNIRSGAPIAKDQLFTLFKKILNINGLDISKEGEHYYIAVAKKPTSLKFYGAGQIGLLQDSPKIITQVIPVQHLSATEAQKLVEPYLSEQGTIFALENHNTLLVNDYESKVLDVVMLLAKIDVSPLSSLKVRLVKIENAPLFDLQDELEEMLTAMRVNKKDSAGVSVLPLERVNSLLLISDNTYLLDRADGWIKQLDVVPSEGRDNIYIYNVRNSIASDLTELVNSMISEDTTSQKTKTPTSTKSTAEKNKTQQQQTSQPKKTDLKKGTSSTLRFAGEPVLLGDDDRNVILIRALPVDYSRIVKLLERLDNLPRQVLIEVMIAEVTLSDGWELGVEWAMKNKDLKINGTSYQQKMASLNSKDGLTKATPLGFTYLFQKGSDTVAMLNMLASENEVSLLSSPQILVLNNEEATVNVGDQVPIVTSETQLASSYTTIPDPTKDSTYQPSVDKTVQYKDTGTILTVTPRINSSGMIILDVDQQVSNAAENTLGGTTSPIISTRQLKTKLALKDGQSVMLGGLIKKDVTFNDSGVPLLKDIPGVGWLFKYQKQSNTKTELLVMITPYVIESEDVLDQYITKFNEKMGQLRQSLNTEKEQQRK